MTTTPKVSVCIPARNHARYLGAAVGSVLAQTLQDVEVIVCDDASDDDTKAVVAGVRDSRVRYARNPVPLGIARNRDRCLMLARGRYIAWLDADDLYHPHMLATQCAVLDRHPRVGLVHGGFDIMDAGDRPLPPWPPAFDSDVIEPGGQAFRELVLLNYVRTSTVVVRREWLERVGAHAAEVGRCSSDWEMWLRLALHTDVAFTAASLARYRVHPASVSAGTDGYERLRCDMAVVARVFRRYRSLIPDAAVMDTRARAALAAKGLLVAADASSRGRRREAFAAARVGPTLYPPFRRPEMWRLLWSLARRDEYVAHQCSRLLLRDVHEVLAGSRLAGRLRKVAGTDPAWDRVLHSVAATVQRLVPATEVIAVIDKCDPTILAVSGRRGWHFPDWRLAPPGYPRDDGAAIEHLEQLRARGARYLVVPSAAFWWLEHYRGFACYLDAACRRIWGDQNCVIYHLVPQRQAACS